MFLDPLPMLAPEATPIPARILQPLYGGAFSSDHAGPLPYVLPGEQVELTAPLTILEPSPHRVAPACVHFGLCGGCHYQHAAYPAQLDLKREILTALLQRTGLVLPAEIPIHSAEPWGYRNRIRLRLEPSAGPGAAPLQAGYSLPGSNQFLPIRMCPIAAPLLWRAAQTLLELAASNPLARRWLAAASEVELFCLPDQSRLQLTLFLRNIEPIHRDPAAFKAFCEHLHDSLPELVGAGAQVDPELGRRLRRSFPGAAWGAAGLAYPAGGLTYWVSRGAFFQVNRFLVETLIDTLVQLVVTPPAPGPAPTLAWDLFAGVGLFTRALQAHLPAARILAVEAGEAASADLAAAAAPRKGPAAFQAVRSSTLDFLRAREFDRDRPDLVVLDPPRAGLGPEASAILARIRPARIVYVSCDPVTLARDLAILTRAYRIHSVHLVDLFPQTFHLETVVHLTV